MLRDLLQKIGLGSGGGWQGKSEIRGAGRADWKSQARADRAAVRRRIFLLESLSSILKAIHLTESAKMM